MKLTWEDGGYLRLFLLYLRMVRALLVAKRNGALFCFANRDSLFLLPAREKREKHMYSSCGVVPILPKHKERQRHFDLCYEEKEGLSVLLLQIKLQIERKQQVLSSCR